MRTVNKIATAILLSLCGTSLVVSPVAMAKKGDCPIDNRKSQAVGERSAKKVQRSFKAYTDGNLDEAIAILLEASPRAKFDKAYVARMLGNFYAEKGDMKKAVKHLKTAVDSNILGGVDHAGTIRLYADLLLQEKQFTEAIPYYYEWMKFTCKQEAIVYRRIGIAYTEQKNWNKVIEVANQGIAISAKPDKGLYQMKLTAYFSLKQNRNAVKVLETMVPLFPEDGRLWVQLAQFYLLTEDYTKSLATFDLAYKNGFLDTAGNITRLAQLLAQQGVPYQAANIFEKNINSGLIEKDAKNLKSLASFYHQAKNLDKAANYYGQAAELSHDGELYLKQGRLLSVEREYTAAIPVFKKALSVGIKNSGEAQFELALAYLGLKKYKSAYKYANLAIKDKKTERNAKSYVSYIKEKARIHKVTL